MQKNYLFSATFMTNLIKIGHSTMYKHITKLGIKPEYPSKKFSYENTRKILSGFVADKKKVTKKVHVFYNFKGGTGKTTLTYQVSFLVGLLGFKVLVIDADSQGHLTYSYGINFQDNKTTLYDIIVNKINIKSAIINLHEGIDIIPSDIAVTRLELPLNQTPNRERVIDKLLKDVKSNYDFIFIDTNPTISSLNQSISYAADTIEIVCDTYPYSLKGLEMLIEELSAFEKIMEKKINQVIIPNKYEAKTVTAQEVLGAIRNDYKDLVSNSIVRKSEDIVTSSKKREPVCSFCASKSSALEDIADLTFEIINRSTVQKDQEVSDENRVS